MPERIADESGELAVILRAGEPSAPGIAFLTDPSDHFQIATIKHPAGHRVAAHVHNLAPRTIDFTREALFVRAGRVRLDLYGEDRSYLCSRLLGPGDVVLLRSGGHGLEIMEEGCDMVEVKQGPYLGEGEKTRFPGVAPGDVRLGG